jgi:hypothetical protein
MCQMWHHVRMWHHVTCTFANILKDTVFLSIETICPRSYSFANTALYLKTNTKSTHHPPIHCKVLCISEFLTINIFNLKYPLLWQTIIDIRKVIKNAQCKLLSIQEQMDITNCKQYFKHSSQKISEEFCVWVNLKYATQYSYSPSEQLSLNKGENSNIQNKQSVFM